MRRGLLPATMLQRVLAGRKRGRKRLGGLEGIAVLDLARLVATLRGDWYRELILEAGGEDAVVPSGISLSLPASISTSIMRVLVDAQRRAGVLGWWYAATNNQRLREKATFAVTKDAPAFPKDPEVAVKAIVSGDIDKLVPSRAIAWFEEFDFDRNRKWPASLRDSAASLLAHSAEQGETVAQAMMHLDGLLGGVTPRAVSVGKAAWLENVVRTNSMTMASAGQYLMYHDNPHVGAFEWFAISDDRICPICLPMDGVILEKGAKLWPPLHYMCRCVVAPVSEVEAEVDDAVGRGDALGMIREHMEGLEAAGETGELGASSASIAYRQFQRLLRNGFGGSSFIEGLQQAGLVR